MPTIDWVVLISYFIGITAYGLWISRHARSSDAYFRGNRKFKWWTMLGQAFGTGTHAEMPVAQAGAAFQGGFATIWYQWKNLLITPLYWLIAPWYRRSRHTTVGELVRERYGRVSSLVYTVFAILFFVFIMGAMLQGAAKVISVATGGAVSSNWVVVGMTLAFMIYSSVGGLVAAAHTEFIQGLLIIVLSFILIPSGLTQIGGFSEMRAILPEDFFQLFSAETGLGAFTIAMLAINGIVGITAQPHMMSMFATGENELVCRVGQTYGNFIKRLVTIGWALTGLIVAALVIKMEVQLDDPEHAFGFASRLLLSQGLMGLMVACILAANMSSCSNFMVNLGALFAKDIYQPYFNRHAADGQLVRAGRIAGITLTMMGVLFALSITNVLSAFLFTETIAAFMGIMIFGGVLWKRANRYGGLTAVLSAFVVYYWLNFIDSGHLQLVYRWKPDLFGWAILAGFVVLVVVSLVTRPEPLAAVQGFFEKMGTHSDQEDHVQPIEDKELILLDVSTWGTTARWKHFSKRYKTDFYGFMLGWVFVFLLIGLAWLIMQIGKQP